MALNTRLDADAIETASKMLESVTGGSHSAIPTDEDISPTIKEWRDGTKKIVNERTSLSTAARHFVWTVLGDLVLTQT
ncbi:MAG: hypothetical protein ACRD3W_11750 [Terriglobales bacterium]